VKGLKTPRNPKKLKTQSDASIAFWYWVILNPK
jgi:hypothetical protein